MKLLRTASLLVLAAVIFVAGVWIGGATHTDNAPANWDSDPSLIQDVKAFNPLQQVVEQPSPTDRITEQQIFVLRDRVTLDIKDAQWATFTDTHSMEPVLSAGANAIEIVPKAENDIRVGDIVSYQSDYADGTIIHRVVYKGSDEQGTYFIMKGDNLPTSDPGRVRFSQMRRVVVAIVY